MHYLYRITNIVNCKVYIGQTINPASRWYKHKADAYREPKQVLHWAIRKHGRENFTCEVIAGCLSQDDANHCEIELIAQYDSRNTDKGYNIEVGGYGGTLSKTSRKKISDANKIAQNDPQVSAKKSKAMKGNTHTLGLRWSEETKQKMSDSHKGCKNSMFGKKHTAETIAKMSANRKGK